MAAHSCKNVIRIFIPILPTITANANTVFYKLKPLKIPSVKFRNNDPQIKATPRNSLTVVYMVSGCIYRQSKVKIICSCQSTLCDTLRWQSLVSVSCEVKMKKVNQRYKKKKRKWMDGMIQQQKTLLSFQNGNLMLLLTCPEKPGGFAQTIGSLRWRLRICWNTPTAKDILCVIRKAWMAAMPVKIPNHHF